MEENSSSLDLFGTKAGLLICSKKKSENDVKLKSVTMKSKLNISVVVLIVQLVLCK